MERNTRGAYLRLVVICSLGLGLCAAEPAKKGSELALGGGAGSYAYDTGGCGVHTRYHYVGHDELGYGKARWQGEHANVVAEGSYDFGTNESARVISTPTASPTSPPETGRSTAFGSVRGGANWAYGGFDLGLSASKANSGTTHDMPGLIPAAGLWLGKPEVLYGFANLFEDGPAVTSYPATIGVGHVDDGWKIRAGASSSGAFTDGEVACGPDVSLGARVDVADHERWTATARIVIPLGKRR